MLDTTSAVIGAAGVGLAEAEKAARRRRVLTFAATALACYVAWRFGRS